MVYVGESVYKCTLYLCNVSKFKKCRKKGCNFYAFEKIKQAVDFSILSYEDKIGCLKEVLKITGADAECADITKYCPKDSEIKGISRIGRKNNYTFKMDNNGKDNMIFVDKSVTGLYERRYTL